jgi:hypothetical protein
VSVHIVGLDKAVGYFQGLTTSARDADEVVVLVGSPLRYARVIETGIRRGRPWRRAGPARMLGRALNEELPSIRRDVTAAVRQGQPIRPVLLRSGFNIQRKAQQYTPVVTGTLRRSFHTREARR